MGKRKKKFNSVRQLGPKLLHLAEEDCVPSKIKFIVNENEVLEISSENSRYFLAPTKYRILINPSVNGKKYPYVIFNTKCKWRGTEEIQINPNSQLKRVYEEVNKNLRDYYANQVKIIKPGTYLLHNLLDGERHSEKAYIKVYTDIGGVLREFVEGSVIRHEGELKDQTFEIVIKGGKEI
jgi:hypothetical protein